MKVLVIDDSIFTLKRHVAFIEQLGGIDVFSAQGGEKGLEAYHDIQPDVIFCDIMMPDMDGFEVLEEIREEDSKINFYFISAELTDITKNKADNLGATGFLEKPITKEVMQKVLSSL